MSLYLFAQIITVDINSWDQMSLQEIIKNIPRDYFESYKLFLVAEPIKAKAIASGTVYFLGDIVSQLSGDKNFGTIDRLRALRAGMFGFIVHGTYRHFYYLWLDNEFDIYGFSQYSWAWVPKLLIDDFPLMAFSYGLFLVWNGVL